MFQTKTPGKRFGSAFAGRRYDEQHKDGPDDKTPEKKNPFAATGASKPSKAPSAEHEAAESSEFEKGEAEGAQEGPEQEGSESPESVVAEKGPATSVHVTFDRVAHKYHVTSTFKDGTVNEADYATPEEAHQAASKLGGAGGAPPEEQTAGAGAAPESDGFQMPELG